MLSSLLLAGLLVQAQEPRELPDTRLPAVISAEQRRIEQQRRPDALIELDLVDLAQRKPLIDIAEVLSEMPGVIARPRNNGAQDTQIQIRGFGARSPFGVRGLRVEYDGIPATAADGQSQMGHLDLSAGGRVSLIRGPFAALYTNGGGYLRPNVPVYGYKLSGIGAELGFDEAAHEYTNSKAVLYGLGTDPSPWPD